MLYTFQLMLNMVPVRDLDYFAAERGGCSALHILSVRELGTGKTIWIQVYLFFQQALKLSRAPCQGKRDREREKVALSPCHDAPYSVAKQRKDGTDVSQSRHDRNHYN